MDLFADLDPEHSQMELAPVPHRHRWSWGARTTLTVLVLAPVFLLVLVPAAFGLERYVMTASAGDVPRGSVVLARDVPLGDLAAGDVVTFGPAGSGELVSGAVLETGGADVRVRVGGDEVALGDRTTVARLVLAVPLVGYPFLGGAFTPALAALALLGGLALCVVFLRDSWRAPPRPHEARPRPRTTDWVAHR